MKKRMIALLCAALLLLSAIGTATAVEPRASSVLSSYGISLTADGDGEMTFRFRIRSPQKVAKVGAQSVEIQKLVDGEWVHHTTFTAVKNPSFYDYDTASSEHTKTFTGTVGVTYKAVLTAYAQGYDGTADTRTAESYSAKCS